MDVVITPLPGLLVLKPFRIEDPRGFLCETYHRRRLAEAGIDTDFVQDNLSLSRPRARCAASISRSRPWRKPSSSACSRARRAMSSSTCGAAPRPSGAISPSSSAKQAGLQLFVPAGFAHGFVTAKPDTLFAYKASNYYSPGHDAGIRFDDPLLAIDWGQSADALILSERDLALPRFDPKVEYFA